VDHPVLKRKLWLKYEVSQGLTIDDIRGVHQMLTFSDSGVDNDGHTLDEQN
jgi:hypothetical protein